MQSPSSSLPRQLSRRFLEVIPRTMWSIRAEMRKGARNTIEGLSLTQFRVMALIHRRPGTATNSQLAENIGVSMPAMSRLVDHLVKRGFVLRAPMPGDRRQTSLKLSSAGRRKFESVMHTTEGRFAEQFATLNEAQKASLASALCILEEIFV